MTDPENDMKCPKCDRPMGLVDKQTFTGEDIRAYHCEACDESVIERNGIALWQALSDANAERDSNKE
jgi:ribosomal protein L37AE/L43A